MSSTRSKYRSGTNINGIIAISTSYEDKNLLARGMGPEHYRELLSRLARWILRQGAHLSYGGYWQDVPDNFTFELLRLISAEQEDNSQRESDSKLQIGKLYNFSPWPFYFDITRAVEAQWINCCRIVRIDQQRAGLKDIVSDADTQNKEPRTAFNTAVTLSTMRRLTMEEFIIETPGVPDPEKIPPIIARISLGGKIDNYFGFLPGIFEEAQLTMAKQRPLYVLGGFGGASEILAKAMLTGDRPPELTLAWHKERNPTLVKLLQSSQECVLRSSTEGLLDALFELVLQARSSLSTTLNTGLSEDETRELLTTRSVGDAVRLVRKGLTAKQKLPDLPA